VVQDERSAAAVAGDSVLLHRLQPGEDVLRNRFWNGRGFASALTVFAVTLLNVSISERDAHAQMTFGEEEVESVEEVSPVAKFLEEGKKLYNDKKYTEASLLFHKVIQEPDVSAEPFKAEAQYELGKTLFRLELYQSALQFFGQVVDLGNAHPFFLPTLRGLVLLTDVVPEDPILMERLAEYTEFYPAEVPEKYRDRFAFLVGRHFYNIADYERALKLLGSVSTRSPDYPRARYILGVSHVGNYDAEPAVQAFKEVLRFLVTKSENEGLSDAEQKLLDLTRLGMARVFYSTGTYDTSLKYYGRIERSSEYWPTALFESSWAYFQIDLYNKALGNLLTINAPHFERDYFPEGPILSAVLFFYNCKYDRVRYVLEDFRDVYVPMKDEVDAVVAKYSDAPDQMFVWLEEQKSGGDTVGLTRVVNHALDDKEIRNKMTLIDIVTKERERLGTLPDKWKQSQLGEQLSNDLELAGSFARGDTGALAIQRLERASRELGNLILEEKAILFEVARAEKGEIEMDLRSSLVVEENVTGKPDVEVSDEELYWTFEGEYWRDELGFYIFNVNSECKR